MKLANIASVKFAIVQPTDRQIVKSYGDCFSVGNHSTRCRDSQRDHLNRPPRYFLKKIKALFCDDYVRP